MYFSAMTRQELVQRIKTKKSYLCVGLDPDLSKIPAHLRSSNDPVYEFNMRIIDATREFCVAYKPNTAFYECLGIQGWDCFEKTLRYIGNDHLTIADAKRGDMGNTATMYAKAFFEIYKADAITLNPYLGKDSIAPFLAYENKWSILLALTSNAGSMDFQLSEILHPVTGREEKLFEQVIHTSSQWAGPDQMMYVVGATHPDLLKHIREMIPEHFLLVPGVGAQGGDLQAISEAGLNSDCGLLVNSSRQIIYASSGKDFAQKAGEEAKKVQQEMEMLLETVLS